MTGEGGKLLKNPLFPAGEFLSLGPLPFLPEAEDEFVITAGLDEFLHPSADERLGGGLPALELAAEGIMVAKKGPAVLAVGGRKGGTADTLGERGEFGVCTLTLLAGAAEVFVGDAEALLSGFLGACAEVEDGLQIEATGAHARTASSCLKLLARGTRSVTGWRRSSISLGWRSTARSMRWELPLA